MFYFHYCHAALCAQFVSRVRNIAPQRLLLSLPSLRSERFNLCHQNAKRVSPPPAATAAALLASNCCGRSSLIKMTSTTTTASLSPPSLFLFFGTTTDSELLLESVAAGAVSFEKRQGKMLYPCKDCGPTASFKLLWSVFYEIFSTTTGITVPPILRQR